MNSNVKSSGKKVVIADNDLIKRKLLCEICSQEFDVLETVCGDEVLDLIETQQDGIAILLLDISVSQGDGVSVLETLHSLGITQSMPVIMLMPEVEEEILEWALSMGASDILQEPYRPSLTRKRIHNLTNMNAQKSETEKLKLEASTDPLTHLLNRRALENKAGQLLGRNQGGKIALCLLDIDNFKQFNDVFGHSVGDRVLTSVSQRLRHHINSGDIIGRVGGDEFVIFLIDIKDAMEAVIRMGEVCNIFLEQADKGISSSIGISIYPKDGKEYRILFDKADKALYQAKNKGKNCCVVYEEKFQRMPFRSSVSEVDQV